MTRNPNVPTMSVSEPIKVALLTEDPLLRTGLSSLLGELGSIEVVEPTAAEVALWDAGVDPSKTLARLAEVRSLPIPAVAVVGEAAHVALPSPPARAASCSAIRSGRASTPPSPPSAAGSP